MQPLHNSSTEGWAGGDRTPPDVPDLDLIRPIGEGGFGVVWLATNRTTGLLRAVKVISLERSGRTDRAGREITSIIRLEANVRSQHPNLLTVQHVGKIDDFLFYIMDPADDLSGAPASSDPSYQPSTLKRRIETGALADDECLRHAQELLAGLACLHKAGMVHRDVKPANCLFVDGRLKLADFGLLTEANRQVSRVGTLKYMPPDGRMDMRADVYAAGLVIYEMIAGLPPENVPRLGERAHEIGRSPILLALNKLILRACDADPQKRFRDAGTMLTELVIVEPRQRHRRPRRRRRMLSVACALFAVAVSVFGLWWCYPRYVNVNFITDPHDAMIYLDNELLRDPTGKPYRTPCTVPDIRARVQHMVFKRKGFEDLDLGQRDFAKIHEIEAEWDSQP